MSLDSQPPVIKARGHGEFLKLWESNAPLTHDELQLCAKVESECSSLMSPSPAPQLPSAKSVSDLPAVGAFLTTPAAPPPSTNTDDDGDGLQALSSVTTPEEFHIWHDHMERRLQDANDEKYRTLTSALTSDRETIQQLKRLIAQSITSITSIADGHTYVGQVVDHFKSDCEAMVSERKKMGELADALRKRLRYFEELETLSAKLTGSSSIQPVDPEFVRLLHRLDECVAYASNSAGAVAEADGYLVRFLELQRRAFVSIRDYTVDTFKKTAVTVAKELKEERMSGAGFRHADLTDASKEYLRFRTVAPKIKSLMSELRARASTYEDGGGAGSRSSVRMIGGTPKSPLPSSFQTGAGSGANRIGTDSASAFSARSVALSLYSDCEECFFEERKRLLEPSVAAHVKSLADVRNMIALARLGSAYVLRVCQLERQLYEHFFPVDSDNASTTAAANGGGEPTPNSPIMKRNNELLRKSYGSGGSGSISSNSSYRGGTDQKSVDDNQTLLTALRVLCDMVYNELRPQILQEEDLDKLVYLIEVLKTEILGDEVPRRGFAGKAFAPSASRAIADAQERIIYRAEVYMRDEIRGFVPTADHLNYPERIVHGASDSTVSTPTKGGSSRQSVGIYTTWYPPVERTLRLLSMLYRCVEGEVFAGVAQEAVAICVQSVGSAAARIAATGKPDAEDHAQLFLVWQLLMTREQIAPFDVEMSYTEHELDFLELRALLGSVIRGKVSARSLAARPTVRERVVDSKRDLDHSVRGACEAFILKTTRALLDPLLSFLAKCNALPANSKDVASAQDGGEAPAASSTDGLLPPTPTKSTAPFESLKRNAGSFAHPKRIQDMWARINKAIQGQLPPIMDRMKIYITKNASRGVLLRPIRANVAEAATELLSVLQLRYSLEERDEIGIDGGHVGSMLDNVDRIMGTTTSASTPVASATSAISTK